MVLIIAAIPALLLFAVALGGGQADAADDAVPATDPSAVTTHRHHRPR
jgi:hypothetical protein